MSYGITIPPFRDGQQGTVTRETFVDEAKAVVETFIASTTFTPESRARVIEHLTAGIESVRNLLWGKTGDEVGESVLNGEEFVVGLSGHAQAPDGSDSPDSLNINVSARRVKAPVG